MNVALVVFLGVLAVILARSNHPSVGFLIGVLVIGYLVVAPMIDHFIRADRIRTPPPRPPGRGWRGRRRGR